MSTSAELGLPLNRHTLDQADANAALIKQEDHALGFVLETLVAHAERNESAVRVIDRLTRQVRALEQENANQKIALGAVLERVERIERGQDAAERAPGVSALIQSIGTRLDRSA